MENKGEFNNAMIGFAIIVILFLISSRIENIFTF